MGKHIDVKAVSNKSGLRFYLAEKDDFKKFLDAFNNELSKFEFVDDLGECNGDDDGG